MSDQSMIGNFAPSHEVWRKKETGQCGRQVGKIQSILLILIVGLVDFNLSK